MAEIKTWNITKTPTSEYVARRKRLYDKLAAAKADAVIVYSDKEMRYLSGSMCMQLERPMALVFTVDGRSAMLGPRLEKEHMEDHVQMVDKFYIYDEYPGLIGCIDTLAEIIKDLGLSHGTVIASHPTYPPICGGRYPDLVNFLPDLKLVIDPYFVYDLKIIKSEFDIHCIRECSRWGSMALNELTSITHPGVVEPEITGIAAGKTTAAMLKCLGMEFDAKTLNNGIARASAGYRGQFAERGAMPHCVTTTEPFPDHGPLVSGAGANILEYNSELERTHFLGEPTKEMVKYFNHAVECQELIFNTIRPGITCADVDKVTRSYYEENGLMNCWRHHTGHSVGMDNVGHEYPYLDAGLTDVVIEPGMVFSVEPGFYVEGLGGFRFSDTIAVTETGIEILTYYPRDIDHLLVY